jgi:O-methyltransferase
MATFIMDNMLKLMYRVSAKVPKPARNLVKGAFSSIGFELQLKNPAKLLQPWETDPCFKMLFAESEDRTVVDKVRCFILYQLIKQTNSLAGDVAEVGVYKGGTAKMISSLVAGTTKQVHLFDTFSGMPLTNPEKDNYYREGFFNDTSLNSVQKFLRNCKNIKIYPGTFPQTATEVLDRRFCFAHVDVDIYQSTLDACNFFYPRLEKGGILLFDDYGFLDCDGEKQAVDEFFKSRDEFPCYLPTGQCFVTKL